MFSVVQWTEHNVMHADPHDIGLRIAGLRHAQGWSQRRLAEAAGVSHGYVAQLELGRLPSPGKFRLDAIAHALNLRTADALFYLGLVPPTEPETEADFESFPADTAAPSAQGRSQGGSVSLAYGSETSPHANGA